jgi:hypothetical protein
VLAFLQPWVNAALDRIVRERAAVNSAPETDEADYETLEAAVMETARGRWFLAEYARRRRAEDLPRFLAAIERLEARAARSETLETRAVGLLGELAAILRALHALGAARPAPAAGDLESRLSALARLDALDADKKLKLFG